MQASSVHFNCFLCGLPATVVSDASEGGYYWVRDCDKCVRYRIRGGVIKRIEQDSPVYILPLLSAAAQRVAHDVDAGKDPPEQLAPHVISQDGKRLLQITDEQAVAEIAANEKLLQNQG